MIDNIKIKNKLPNWSIHILKYYLGAYRLFIARKKPSTNYKSQKHEGKKNILFYDINGLSYAGTQKFIQILAKYLNKNKYNVFFMYSSKNHNERKFYLENSGVKLIDFNYTFIETKLPYYIENMSPHIFDVIKDNKIDLVIIPGSGYPEFPTANLTKMPIISLNVFGSINIQKNIIKHICMSNLLEDIISVCIPKEKIETLYIPSEGPTDDSYELGKNLRKKLNLFQTDVVFGRIGRPDDNIFDPIGILAFQSVVKKYPHAYYFIVAPAPKLKNIVEREKIPNVIFLDPIAQEKDVWAFHQALDAMAHFRLDGETCGLNIAESMLCAKPIITHKSPIWNAHLEYLEPSFSRVAEIGNVEQYASYMEEFIQKKQTGELVEMGKIAKAKADKLFLIENNINKFETWIDESLEKFYGSHPTN